MTTLAEMKPIVLHELRGAGPLGLSRDELRDRIQGGDLLGAVTSLLADGALVEALGGLLTISPVQRALDDVDGARLSWRDVARQFEAEAGALRTHVATLSARLRSCSDVAIFDALEAERTRCAHLEAGYEEALDTALAQRCRADSLSAIVGGHALAAIGQACAAAAGSSQGHDFGRRLYDLAMREAPLDRWVEARTRDEQIAYRLGIWDASWVASYAPEEPPLLTARVTVDDGTVVRCAVLGRVPGRRAFLLSSPFTGRLQWEIEGFAPRGWDVHPDDAAVLRESFVARLQEVA